MQVITENVLKQVKIQVLARYGSLFQGGKALGIKHLGRYLGNCRTRMPLDAFLKVVQRIGLDLEAIPGVESSNRPLNFLPYLDEPSKGDLSSEYWQTENIVDRVTSKLRKLSVDSIDVGEESGLLNSRLEIQLINPRLSAVELSEEFKLLSDEFRRRQQGGTRVSSETVLALAEHIILRAAFESRVERYNSGSAYLRLFLRLPLSPDSGILGFGLALMVTHLNRTGEPRRAKQLGDRVFSLIMVGGAGDQNLTAFFALAYSAVQGTLGKDPIQSLRLCCSASPSSRWAHLAVAGLVQRLIILGDLREALGIAEQVQVPKNTPDILYRMYWLQGSIYARLGEGAKARDFFWQAVNVSPALLGGFKLVLLLIELVGVGEAPLKVYQELRRLNAFLTCSDKSSGTQLREAVRLLEYELLKDDGPCVEGLDFVSSICGHLT